MSKIEAQERTVITKRKIDGKTIYGVFFSLVMLFSTVFTGAQEVKLANWGYGAETSFEFTSGDGPLGNYSVSLQLTNDLEDKPFRFSVSGFSLDFIHREMHEERTDGSKHNITESGILGGVDFGYRISRFFIPYVGGGLGFRFGADDNFFGWKVDAGVLAWPSNLLYVKTGVTYDNIRQGLGVSVGAGVKLTKRITEAYRGYNGSTYNRSFTKYLWNDNSTPAQVSADTLVSSERIRTYQKTTTSSYYEAAHYELQFSGGETYTTELTDRNGRKIGEAKTTTPRKDELVKTRDAQNITNYYVYNVTVTRNWYIRTFYYKNRDPTTSDKFYRDSESAVLVDKYSRTEKR